MKEKLGGQMDERNKKFGKSNDQQSGDYDNSPEYKRLVEEGALTQEESKKEAEIEQGYEESHQRALELLRDQKTSFTPPVISEEERERIRKVGEMTLENSRIPLNRRRPESFYKRPGDRK